MAYEQVMYDVTDRVATVTLNRPEKLNAWTATMEREVRQAMDAATRDEAVRAIVLSIAGEDAAFTTAFSRRGLVAEHGISWTLPRLVGLSNALDLLLSSRRIGAAEALRLGLVNQVLPQAQLADGVRAYVRDLVTLVSPRSMAVMKRQLWDAQFTTLAEAIDAADVEMLESFASEDFKEGVAHFVQKRAPVFTGR